MHPRVNEGFESLVNLETVTQSGDCDGGGGEIYERDLAAQALSSSTTLAVELKSIVVVRQLAMTDHTRNNLTVAQDATGLCVSRPSSS